jgi:hypothetical protein
MNIRDLQVVVYHEEKKVFDGELGRFLKDNEDDEYLLDVCQSLSSIDCVVFGDHHIGNWKIERISGEFFKTLYNK